LKVTSDLKARPIVETLFCKVLVILILVKCGINAVVGVAFRSVMRKGCKLRVRYYLCQHNLEKNLRTNGSLLLCCRDAWCY